jgi:hypothetical protein
MAIRKESEPLQRVTLSLYKKDYQRMLDIYPVVGAAKVIRMLVHQHVSNLSQKIEDKLELIEELELEID